MTNTTEAQTQADLDAATLAANIAEQQKKAAEAKKAAAVAEADAGAVSAKAANDLAKSKADSDKAKADAEKAKADAEKAQVDAVKAGLPTPPDPAKYKIDKPTAPALNATIARLTFEQAERLANSFEKAISAAIVNTNPPKKFVLIPDDAKVRTLLALAQATREGIISVETRVQALTTELKGKKANQPLPAFAPGALLLIGSLLENIVSYATILRTQFGFTTASTTNNAEAALATLVQSKLILSGKVSMVDADATLPLPSNLSDLFARLGTLRGTISAARKEVSETAGWSKTKRETPAGDTEAAKKARADALKLADEADRIAELLAKTTDEADKFLAALFVVDALGNTPFDASQRGEALAETLKTVEKKLTLTIKVITADADTVATDRLFSGLKVYIGNTTMARWKLVESNGVVLGTGAGIMADKPEQVQLSAKSP